MGKERKMEHKGGVIRMADELVECEKTENVQRPWSSVVACSILLYPAGEGTYKDNWSLYPRIGEDGSRGDGNDVGRRQTN